MMDCALRLPKPRSYRFFSPLVSSTSLSNASRLAFKSHFSFSPVAAAASVQNRSAARKQSKQNLSSGDDDEDSEGRGDSGVILSACLVGVLTGIGVVLFNNGVHEIRDIFWDGIPSRGASWLREAPIDSVWVRVILVPASGGLIVGFLNAAREAISRDGNEAVAALRPLLKAVAACVTLGTGNSLGPEGPSVEIGSSVAKGVHHVFDKNPLTRLSLLAAGSAAGISSGFNAAVAGCFFAVESVLWPSADSSVSLTNTTSTVILSAVIASVVSEIGLGSEPAFKVPDYDFRSPGELPLYLLLGILCGLVSLALSRCTSYLLSFIDAIHKDVGIPKPVFPILGGLSIGVISLAYPEILYWGFENVDILLESRPFVNCLSADLLFQLVGVKILATSLCRASGLVGGYYAPSLFIGAATGMAYGKFINFTVAQFNPTVVFPLVEVASPQAYGLVGMAATLAGVCQVPLTSVLLLFELTQDYRIVLPLLGAVGLSSWVTSGQMKRKSIRETKAPEESSTQTIQQLESLPDNSGGPSSIHILPDKTSDADNICEVESSLCVEDLNIETTELRRKIFVSEAMRTRYVTVLMSTLLTEAVTLMLAEKQSCAIMVDGDNLVIGLLTLTDIQEFSTYAKYRSIELKELLISDICELDGKKCRESWTATPMMDLLSAVRIMNKHGVSQVAVVLEHVQEFRGCPVGLLDRECISLTYRAIATRESLV